MTESPPLQQSKPRPNRPQRVPVTIRCDGGQQHYGAGGRAVPFPSGLPGSVQELSEESPRSPLVVSCPEMRVSLQVPSERHTVRQLKQQIESELAVPARLQTVSEWGLPGCCESLELADDTEVLSLPFPRFIVTTSVTPAAELERRLRRIARAVTGPPWEEPEGSLRLDVRSNDAVAGLVGRGGFAEVLRCRRRSSAAPGCGELVAVKCIPKQRVTRSFRGVRQLLVEALTSLYLPAHSGLLRTHEVLHDAANVYFVMPLAPGERLDVAASRLAPLPPSAVSPVIQQLLNALGALHAAGIVHRDVKCDNILVDGLGSDTVRVCLLDFGFARYIRPPVHAPATMEPEDGEDAYEWQGLPSAEELRREVTSPTYSNGAISTPCGAPEFYAPELIAAIVGGTGGLIIDSQLPKVDVYGVGVIAFALLTGHRPYVHPRECAQLTVGDARVRQRNATRLLPEVRRRAERGLTEEWLQRSPETYAKLSSGLRQRVAALLSFAPADRPTAAAALKDWRAAAAADGCVICSRAELPIAEPSSEVPRFGYGLGLSAEAADEASDASSVDEGDLGELSPCNGVAAMRLRRQIEPRRSEWAGEVLSPTPDSEGPAFVEDRPRSSLSEVPPRSGLSEVPPWTSPGRAGHSSPGPSAGGGVCGGPTLR
eukprot:TRINITY_DN2416_c0_g1_i1.p1 TRINITY_DN2416_c0_g1~~TRINITY_DN2416_c0_g1_i1.p1  ORF type:complete len:705 (+),score=172.73 TRINITY_DN2416_c0_g1_i1:153-2117(+)